MPYLGWCLHDEKTPPRRTFLSRSCIHGSIDWPKRYAMDNLTLSHGIIHRSKATCLLPTWILISRQFCLALHLPPNVPIFFPDNQRWRRPLLSPFWCSVPGTFYTYSIPAHPCPGLCDPAPTCVTSIHLKRLWLSYGWTTTELPRFPHDNLVSCKPFNFTLTLLTQSLIQ